MSGQVIQGIFAQGQLYVLVSRVTDPRHFVLIGIPPRDLVADVARAVYAAGLDVDEFYDRACTVTNDWMFVSEAKNNLADRIQQRVFKADEKSTPLIFRTLGACLDPQPDASAVIHRLLAWIDRCDQASRDEGAPRPPFCTPEGEDIFPPEDGKWWLTDLSRRRADAEEAAPPAGDEDGPHSDESEGDDEDDDVIDPVLPVEDDAPFKDDDEDGSVASGAPLEVDDYSHTAKVPEPLPDKK